MTKQGSFPLPTFNAWPKNLPEWRARPIKFPRQKFMTQLTPLTQNLGTGDISTNSDDDCVVGIFVAHRSSKHAVFLTCTCGATRRHPKRRPARKISAQQLCHRQCDWQQAPRLASRMPGKLRQVVHGVMARFGLCDKWILITICSAQ